MADSPSVPPRPHNIFELRKTNTKQSISNVSAILLANLVVFPLDKLKLIRQTNPILKQNMLEKNQSSFSLAKSIIENHGWRSLWNGSKLMMVRLAINSMFRSYTYYHTKLIFLPKGEDKYSVKLESEHYFPYNLLGFNQ